MAAPNKRPFSMRLGMRQYTITEEEFLDPGALVDSVIDEEICETGGFIARLETWTPEDGARTVAHVKQFIKEDVTNDSFHPEWLRRQSLLHIALFDFDPVHAQTVVERTKKKEDLERDGQKEAENQRRAGDLERLQRKMRGEVEACAFSPDESGDLCLALREESVLHAADVALDNLENLQNHVVYLQNMTVTPPLDTCPGVNMTRQMKSGLEKLSHLPLKGINTPTVYIGTEFSTFPAHREDMSFCAMNRHIAGAPKVWFCIPPAYYDAFIKMLTNMPIPDDQKSSACQLLHKNLWPSPRMVIACGIPVHAIVQRPGDVVLLLPNTIHWGFNTNYNMNEAMNFVCKAWVLPGMLSHQRCLCKKAWICKFEINDVLTAHGADPEAIKQWKAGHTLIILEQLKRDCPALYPGHKQIYEHHLDEEMMAKGIVKALSPTNSQPDTSSYVTCSRCQYTPKRCRSDALDRIAAHVKRCHGEGLFAEIMEEVRLAYSNTKKKNFKCKEHTCPRCGKTVRGNWNNVLDHQRRRNCIPADNEEDADDVDSPSSSTASGRSDRKRRKSSRP